MSVTIAVAKGRIAQDFWKIWDKAGLACPDFANSRRLIVPNNNESANFIMVKPADVPVYVENGIADIGIVGRDTLLEEGRELYELLDLGFGKCRFSVAGLPEQSTVGISRSYNPYRRVATKYPNITRQYFKHLGEQVEIIKLNGSVELAPLLGLADLIVDIVETGRTLRENGLVLFDDICQISTQLVANRVSLKMKQELIELMVQSLAAVVEVPR